MALGRAKQRKTLVANQDVLKSKELTSCALPYAERFS